MPQAIAEPRKKSLEDIIQEQNERAEAHKLELRGEYRALLAKSELSESQQERLLEILPALEKSIADVSKDRHVIVQEAAMAADLKKRTNEELLTKYREVRDAFNKIDEEHRALTEKRRLAELALLGAQRDCDSRDSLMVRRVALLREHPDLFD